MTISINNPHLAIVAGMKTKPEIGPADNMFDLYRRNEAGDYWESGYASGKAIPDGGGANTTLIGQKYGELVLNTPQGGSAGLEGAQGGPVQWRTELYRMRSTLTRPLSDTFAMWVFGSCSDVGWNCWMQFENGPYIYNISPQYNFQAGRPGTQGVQSNITNPSNACMLVQVEAGVGTSFWVNDVLIGTNAGVSYAAGINQFDLFATWGGGARMNGRTRAFGCIDRVLLPEERTMIHQRNIHLYTVGE